MENINENMNADKISQSIRACRKRQGLSQDELADRLHVTRQAVSKWENGSALPSVDMLIALANVFQLSVDELLGVEREARADRARWEARRDALEQLAQLSLLHVQPPS